MCPGQEISYNNLNIHTLCMRKKGTKAVTGAVPKAAYWYLSGTQ